jgi:hypothetical protein
METPLKPQRFGTIFMSEQNPTTSNPANAVMYNCAFFLVELPMVRAFDGSATAKLGYEWNNQGR